MGKRLRAALLSTAAAISITASVFMIYGKVQENKRSDAQEQRIQQLVSRFKACPERFSAVSSCNSPEEMLSKRSQAERLRDQSNYEEAGIKFAELNLANEAREMAGRCAQNGNTKGRARILEELSIRTKAITQAREEIGQ
jgi:hypothetical protein